MILQQGALGQQRGAAVDVGDDLRLVHRHIHVELNIEGFRAEIADALHLEPSVQERLHPQEGRLKLSAQICAVSIEIHVPEADGLSGCVPEVRVFGIDGGCEIIQVTPLLIQERQYSIHVDVCLQLIDAAVTVHADRQVLLQLNQELTEILAAVIPQHIDELCNIPKHVGGHTGLPVVIVHQLLDEAQKRKFLLVVSEPDERHGSPVIRLRPICEMAFLLLGDLLVMAVVVLVSEPAYAFQVPEFSMANLFSLLADKDGLLVEANKAVQLIYSLPERDDLLIRQNREAQLPLGINIGLQPAHTIPDGILSDAVDLPAEFIVKQSGQRIAVLLVLSRHRPRAGQEISDLLIHHAAVNRVLNAAVGASFDVHLLLLDIRAVFVILLRRQDLRILRGLSEVFNLLADDLLQRHRRRVWGAECRIDEFGLSVLHRLTSRC